MKRPEEHVKEDASRRILEDALPRDWILRDVKPDYGIDKTLEVVENGKVTGKELSIQLKGTDKPDIIGALLSFSLETDNLKYYLERDGPVILVVVDLVKKQCYWIFLQDFVYRKLEVLNPKWKNQKYVTVHIPIEQKVSETIEILKETAIAGSAYIVANKMLQIPSNHLAKWEDDADAIIQKSKTASNLFKKALQLKIETSYHHAKEGNRAESNKELESVLNTARTTDDKEAIITSTLLITYQMNLWGENKEIWELLASIKNDVETLNSKTYRILYQGSILETLYIHHVYEYSSLSKMTLVSSQFPKGFMTPFLQLQTQKIIQEMYEIETEYIKNLIETYKSDEYFIYADLLERLARMHFTWVNVNAVYATNEVILKLMSDIERMLILAKTIANVASTELGITIRLDMARLYHFIDDARKRDECLKEAAEISRKIGHKGYMEGVSDLTSTIQDAPSMAMIQTQLSKKTDPDDISLEEEEKIIRMLLRKGGIDIEGTDRLAEMAKVGLKDRNPERVLKHCEHFFTEIVNYGPIWEPMGLPETGTKILYCEKKGVIIGHSLDVLLASFKERYCKDCKDHSPKPADWKWTRKWHSEREHPEGMKRAIESFFNH